MTKPVEPSVSEPARYVAAPCKVCGGEGGQRVTGDMASDAGDRSMEGAFFHCGTCQGEGYVEVPRCEATRTIKLPYDSSPETVTLQCLLPEDHGDEHEFAE